MSTIFQQPEAAAASASPDRAHRDGDTAIVIADNAPSDRAQREDSRAGFRPSQIGGGSAGDDGSGAPAISANLSTTATLLAHLLTPEDTMSRETTPLADRPYRVYQRPAGDFVVQRFHEGKIQRWGAYETRAEANSVLRIANAGRPK
jgi:hypothetical protein